jgi:hypothetical protein
MRRLAVILGFLLIQVVTSPTAHAAPGGDGGGGGVPLIEGARQVDIRNTTGGLSVYTSIPGGSVFSSYGGGPAAECNGSAPLDDPLTPAVEFTRQPIRSTRLIFKEGAPTTVGPVELPVDLETFVPAGVSLADTVRTFTVYCFDTFVGNYLDTIQVSGLDPMLDPRPRLTSLYNGLQLEPISIYDNDVVNRWGGLVVRNPAWFAINNSAWTTQRSNPQYYRGWTLYLILQPKALDFNIKFVPDPDRPTEPYSGVITCVTGPDDFTVYDSEFPARPNNLADFAEPGQNQACEWTPPGPGKVTVTARQTFTVTFWANGATQTQPDYTFESEPTTYRVGELVAVNVND